MFFNNPNYHIESLVYIYEDFCLSLIVFTNSQTVLCGSDRRATVAPEKSYMGNGFPKVLDGLVS